MARLEGYAEVRSALRRLGPEAARQLTAELKDAGREQLVPEARHRAPRDRGKLASSIQVFPRAKDVYFGSRKVYAPVQEFGGTIVHHGPRHQHRGGAHGKVQMRSRTATGAPTRKTRSVGRHLIRIKPQPFIRPALAHKQDEVVEAMSARLAAAARQLGFTTGARR